jgi:hypothetical protein
MFGCELIFVAVSVLCPFLTLIASRYSSNLLPMGPIVEPILGHPPAI